MGGVERVHDDGGGSTDAALLVQLHQAGEWGTNDFAGCLDQSVEPLFVLRAAATEPGGEAIGRDAFNGAPVEGGEVCGREACFPESVAEVELLLSFSEDFRGVSG